jgi:hypothetical protein
VMRFKVEQQLLLLNAQERGVGPLSVRGRL